MQKLSLLRILSIFLLLSGCWSIPWNQTAPLSPATNPIGERTEGGEGNTDLAPKAKFPEMLPEKIMSTKNSLNYLQDIYRLVASWTKIEEISDIPEFRIYYSPHSNPIIHLWKKYPESLVSMTSYKIGDYILVLCGVGGGAFSYYGNTCYLFQQLNEQGVGNMEMNINLSLNGLIMTHEKTDEGRSLASSISHERSNAPKALLIKDRKLLLITLDGDGAGSGEGKVSIFTLQENGERKLTDCRYYVPDCTVEEQVKDEKCYILPKMIERFEQYPLEECIENAILRPDF